MDKQKAKACKTRGVREESEPGATRMWFGTHKGQRIDELPNRYVQWALNEGLNSPTPNMRKFRKHYQKYESTIEKSPGSIIVWFRPWKDREFQALYKDNGPRGWDWHMSPGNSLWRPRLKEIAQEYELWEKDHAKTEGIASSTAQDTAHPRSKLLEDRDDVSPTEGHSSDKNHTDDGSESNDNFVLPDASETPDGPYIYEEPRSCDGSSYPETECSLGSTQALSEIQNQSSRRYRGRHIIISSGDEDSMDKGSNPQASDSNERKSEVKRTSSEYRSKSASLAQHQARPSDEDPGSSIEQPPQNRRRSARMKNFC